MTYAESRERGHVPTEQDLDPFDWCIQRLAGGEDFWAYMKRTFEVDLPDFWVELANEQTVRGLIAHMIKNADYEGLKVAMTVTWTEIADWENTQDRMHADRETEAAIRARQMRNPCSTCGAQAHEPCTKKGAHGPVEMSRPHKWRSAA